MCNKKLYWISTDDHDEDWFVISSSRKGAINFFRGSEGYCEDDKIKAEYICRTPRIYEHGSHYGQIDMLKEMKFKIIDECPTRLVWGKGRLFCEGYYERTLMQREAFNKQVLYVIRMRGHSLYKIGITNNFITRFETFRTAIPFGIYVMYIIPLKNARYHERTLHNILKEHRFNREWFSLNNRSIDKMEAYLLPLWKKSAQ